VIRFSAFLVVVALGLLVAGVVTSRLTLVYAAIGVSGVALLALGVGALLKRGELFGEPKTAQPDIAPLRTAEPKTAEPGLARPEPAGVRVPFQPEPQVMPWSAAVPAGSGPAASDWPAPFERPAAAQARPSTAGYLPADQPPRIAPTPAWPPAAASSPAIVEIV
jgi:hypothetical protein